MNRKALWIGGALLFLILLYIFYPSEQVVEGYKVGRDPRDLGVDLYGKETNLVAVIDDLLSEMKPSFDPMSVGREYLRGELEKGILDGIIAYGNGEGVPYQGLLSSQTYFPLGPILVVKMDSPIVSLSQMEGKSLGVEKNSGIYLALNKIPQFRIVPSDTIWTLFDLVLTHRVDGIVLDTLQAYLYLQRIHKNDLRFVLPPLTNAGIKLFALPSEKGKQVIQTFEKNLAELREQKKILPIFEKWGFTDYPTFPPSATNPPPIELPLQ